jgi:hypothetical protein
MKRTILALTIGCLPFIASAAPPDRLVRDVDNPARQAVMIQKYTSTSIFETIYTVPVDKIFVLEQMNCSALTDSVYVGIFQGSLTHANIVYSVPPVGTTGTVTILDGHTRVYFNPGTDLNLRIFTSGQTTCTLSGYTVDVL